MDTAADLVIGNERDLFARLGATDVGGVADWFDNRLTDPVAYFDVECTDDELVVVAFAYTDLDPYTIHREYPFTVADLKHDADALEDHFAVHADLLSLEGRPVGDPGGEEDATEDLAAVLQVGPGELTAVLGGRWDPVEDLPRQGSNGERVYAWWAPADGRPVVFGVGGEAVYSEPVVRGDDGAVTADTSWPVQQLALFRAREDGSAAEFLTDLAHVLDDPTPSG